MKKTTTRVPWTRFMDMHSGGDQKEKWSHIYIQAPEAEAKVVFYNKFGHNPERVTCTCCGPDYSISEAPTLREITAYERGCDCEGNKWLERPSRYPSREYQTVRQFMKADHILIIAAKDIWQSERIGKVPEQGYVWVG